MIDSDVSLSGFLSCKNRPLIVIMSLLYTPVYTISLLFYANRVCLVFDGSVCSLLQHPMFWGDDNLSLDG